MNKLQMRHKILFLVFSCSSAVAAGQDTIQNRHYDVQYGSNPNIESGAESAIGISSLVFDQTNLFIGNKIKNKTINTLARIGSFGLVQIYFGSQLYGTIPHEYFGHYSRAREFGIKPRLHLNFPALGGDNIFLVDQNTPVLQRQMIVAAGPEVTAEVAYKATQRLYTDDYSPAFVGDYLLAGKVIDQLLYLQNNVKPFIDNPNKYYSTQAEYFRGNPVPNDPLSYMLALTESYGYYDSFLNKKAIWVQQFPDMKIYTQNNFIRDQYRRAKLSYLQTAIDPTNIYFIYGNMLYLTKGQSFFKPFMFRIKSISLMPSVRANFGENGIENYYDIFFKMKNMPAFSLYYRAGGNMFHQTRGAGIEFRSLMVGNNININGQIDYWNNGRMKTNNFNVTSGLKYAYHKMLFNGNIGYKSYGNLMGKPFDEGVYGYVGLGLNLNYIVKNANILR